MTPSPSPLHNVPVMLRFESASSIDSLSIKSQGRDVSFTKMFPIISVINELQKPAENQQHFGTATITELTTGLAADASKSARAEQTGTRQGVDQSRGRDAVAGVGSSCAGLGAVAFIEGSAFSGGVAGEGSEVTPRYYGEPMRFYPLTDAEEAAIAIRCSGPMPKAKRPSEYAMIRYHQLENDATASVQEWRDAHGADRVLRRGVALSDVIDARAARDNYYAVSGREMADAVEREMMRSGVRV